MKRLLLASAFIAALALTVLASSCQHGLSLKAKRGIASEEPYYRIMGPNPISPSEQILHWSSGYRTHPLDACAGFEKSAKYVVERLDDSGEYTQCGTCQSFKCGVFDNQSTLKNQEPQVQALLSNYLNAVTTCVVNEFNDDSDLASREIECNTIMSEAISAIRRFKISSEVKAYFGKKFEGAHDEAAIMKLAYIALHVFSEGQRAELLKDLHSLKVSPNPQFFFFKADSMFIPEFWNSGSILLSESFGSNDAFLPNNEPYFMDNMYGLRGFVTLLHEMGHFVDDKIIVSPLIFYSNESKWKTLAAKDDSVSFYSLTSYQENFAESFTAYLLDPLFQCYSPNRYAFFTNHVRTNEQVYGGAKPFSNIACNSEKVSRAVIGRKKIMSSQYGQSLLAMTDELPLLLDGMQQKKPPTSLCRKDSYCDNDKMGCQTFYINPYGQHTGRCRLKPFTGESGEDCDRDRECKSNHCSWWHCK